MRPNVEFRIDLPKTNPGLAKSHLQKARGYAQKTTPNKDLPYLLLNYFWPIVGVLPRLPIGLLVVQLPPLHRVGRAMPHSQTKVVFVFAFYFPCTFIRIRVGFLSYQSL